MWCTAWQSSLLASFPGVVNASQSGGPMEGRKQAALISAPHPTTDALGSAFGGTYLLWYLCTLCHTFLRLLGLHPSSFGAPAEERLQHGDGGTQACSGRLRVGLRQLCNYCRFLQISTRFTCSNTGKTVSSSTIYTVHSQACGRTQGLACREIVDCRSSARPSRRNA